MSPSVMVYVLRVIGLPAALRKVQSVPNGVLDLAGHHYEVLIGGRNLNQFLTCPQYGTSDIDETPLFGSRSPPVLTVDPPWFSRKIGETLGSAPIGSSQRHISPEFSSDLRAIVASNGLRRNNSVTVEAVPSRNPMMWLNSMRCRFRALRRTLSGANLPSERFRGLRIRRRSRPLDVASCFAGWYPRSRICGGPSARHSDRCWCRRRPVHDRRGVRRRRGRIRRLAFRRRLKEWLDPESRPRKRNRSRKLALSGPVVGCGDRI
jgi:hypothetical protein